MNYAGCLLTLRRGSATIRNKQKKRSSNEPHGEQRTVYYWSPRWHRTPHAHAHRMRHLRAHGNLCAQAVRRFVEQPYAPLLYVQRAQIPASGSVHRQVTGSLLRKGVVSYCTYKPGIKFKSAYRILGVVRGVLDGRGFLFCWDFWSVKKLFRWLTMRDVSLLDVSAFFCFLLFYF